MKRILAIALLALLAGSGPAAADPISIAILGALSIAATPFAVGVTTFLLTTVASFALSFVSSLFRPKPKKAEGGVQSQIQIGGDVPRSAIFGKQATAGHIVYVNTYGTNNAMLEMVFALGDGQHEGLSRVWVNGKLHGLTQPGAETHYVVDDFEGKLTLTFVSGTEDQTALAALVTNANPAGRWTANHTLSGIAYVVARFQFDEKVFANGIPQLLFEMEGLRLYDPRLDSTNGGSGSHRWDNPATWAYSENPAIHLYNYQRGIFLNGERVLGMGLPASDLNTASYVAAANICDEAVSLAGGGTEPRYRCGFNVSDGMQHSEVIDRFVEAMGGVIAERAGQYTVFAGVAQTSVVTITDGDLVLGKPRTYSAKKSRTERVNAVFGTYSNPDEQWKAVAFPAFTSDTFEADDGGERIAVNLDLAQVFSVTQAQRLAMIERRLGRLQGTAEISLPFAYIRLEAGDWITWNSDRFGFAKVWQVASAKIEPDQTIRVSLREIATNVYSWISGDDELDVAQPGVGPSRPPLAGSVSGLDAEPITIEGDTGGYSPAIRVTWTPIEDETVVAVILQHRIGTDGEERETRSINRLGGFAVIADGIQPGTAYQVRGTIETVPAREVTWSSWVDVTTGDLLAPPSSVDFDALDDLLQAEVEKAQAALDDASDIRKAISQIPDVRASIAGKIQFPLYDLMASAARSIDYVLGQVQTTKDRITSAGIEVDSASGRVVIRGVDQLRSETQTQLSSVQATFDAQNAAISLRATKAELDAAVEAVLASFTPAYRWEFNGTAEGWTGSDATLTTNVGSLDVEATDTGAYIESQTLALDADLNKVVALRIKRLAGTGWGLNLQWGASFANSRAISVPAAPDEWNILRLDQSGQTGWEGELTALRLTVEDGTEVEIDYIEIGNSAINDLIVGDLSLRMSEAEIRLDAAESAIDLKATLVDLGEAEDRITTAETRLDAAEAAITLRVTQLEREEDLERLTTVEISLDAANNRITSTVSSAQTNADLISFLASAVTNGLLNALKNFHDLNTALAYASQTLGARIDETGAAVASLRTELTAFAGSSSALFYQETIARAAADEALTTQLTVQSAALAAQDDRLTDAEAAIATETTTRAAADTALASAQTLISATLSTKSRTFYQPAMPPPSAVGDLWIDSDDNNRLYRWSGTGWASAQDGVRPTVFAQTSAPTALAVDDVWVDTDAGNAFYKWNGTTWAAVSGVSTFYQATKPTGTTAGDLWVNTSESNRLYRFTGPIWSEITGISRFYTNTAPTATAIGDLWINWASSNAISRWSGSAWVLVTDVATYYQTTAPTGVAVGTLWIDSDDSRRAFTYSGAEWLTVQSGSKNAIFAQDNAPVATAVGDVWYDSNDGFKPYRWDGSSWVSVQDANRNKVFAQTSAPTATAVGDLWFDTDDGNKQYRWNGTSWVDMKDGRLTTAEGTITTLSTTKVDATGAAAAATTVINSRFGAEGDPGSIEAEISTLSSTKVDATGAAAQATSVVNARFGAFGDPGSIEATVSTAATAAADAEDAVADLETSVNAQIGDLNASGIFKVTAVTSPPTGATSGFQMLVKASDSGNFANAGIKAYAIAGGGGSPQGYTVLVGDKIYREPSSGGTPVLMVDSQGRFVGDALGSGIVNTFYEYTRPERAGDDTMGVGTTASGAGNGWYVDGTDFVGSLTVPANPNSIGAGAPNSTYGSVLTTVNASVRNAAFGWGLGSSQPMVVAFRVRFDNGAGGVYWSDEGLIACSSGWANPGAAYGFGGNPGTMTDIVSVPSGTYNVYLEYRWGPRTANGLGPTPSAPTGLTVRISAKIVCLLLKK